MEIWRTLVNSALPRGAWGWQRAGDRVLTISSVLPTLLNMHGSLQFCGRGKAGPSIQGWRGGNILDESWNTWRFCDQGLLEGGSGGGYALNKNRGEGVHRGERRVGGKMKEMTTSRIQRVGKGGTRESRHPILRKLLQCSTREGGRKERECPATGEKLKLMRERLQKRR